jgi:uncharacterized protein (DUF2336 family)
MPPKSETLIAELEWAVRRGTSEKRVDTLRQVTDLFLNDSDRLNDEQIKVFDDVLGLLINRIESKALAELSRRLAPVDNAPIDVVRRLAHNDEITVAGPVLAESRRLSSADLAEIAGTRSQAHLLAISGRHGLEEKVTDVLVERGNREVVYQLATNASVRFSDGGYDLMVKKAEGDDALAEKVGLRLDIPSHSLRALLLRATDAVRSRLLSLAPAQAQDAVRGLLATVTGTVSNEPARPRDFSAAELLVRSMQDAGSLNDAAVLEFASSGKYEEMTAAVAVLCAAPLSVISDLMMGVRNDAVLIPCRAAGLTWPTVEAILRNRHASHVVSEQVIDLARNDFNRLTDVIAQRTLRSLQVRAIGV